MFFYIILGIVLASFAATGPQNENTLKKKSPKLNIIAIGRILGEICINEYLQTTMMKSNI